MVEMIDVYSIKNKPVSESKKAKLAFEIFYALGDDRSYRKVAEHPLIQASPKTISTWASKYAWKDRVRVLDNQQLELMRISNAREFEAICDIYRQSIRKTVFEKYIKPVKDGDIPFDIKSPRDLKTLIEIDVMLSGGAPERPQEDKERKQDKKVVSMILNDEEAWEMLNERITRKMDMDNSIDAEIVEDDEDGSE